MADERVKRIQVFLADDHIVVRRGIARIVQGEHDMEVVGEAGDGAEAVKAVLRLRPDVVLMDIGMPVSGIDAARQIHEAAPDSRVLILTVYDQEDLLFRALQAGASGYMLKGATVDEVLEAIRTVHSGGVFICPSMTAKLVRDYVVRLESGERHDESGKLSAREREVLPLVAEGLTNHEIAQKLCLSPYTVQTYRQRIMEKLDLHSRTELLKYALRKGFLRLEK